MDVSRNSEMMGFGKIGSNGKKDKPKMYEIS